MALRWLRLFVIPACCLATAIPLTWGQSAPSPDAPPVSTVPADNSPTEAPRETLKVTSNLVSEYFTVRDKHNALIPYLTKNDCSVFEDKEPQKLTSFVAEANQPLTLGILIDTSGSQQNVLPLEQQSGSAFLKRILRPKDEAFLLSFDVGVNLEQDYTNNTRELDEAINKVQINTAGGGGAMGVPGIGQGPVPVQGTPKGTLLYDAVYLAANNKMRSETGRKALILLTDGEDQGSETKPKAAIEAAQNSNTIIYVIMIADRGFYFSNGYPLGGYSGDMQMRQLTEATGGRVINVGNNGKKLEDAFDQIEQELRTQYVAQYVPANKEMDGRFRRVDIFCKDQQDGDLKVAARKGYFAVGDQE